MKTLTETKDEELFGKISEYISGFEDKPNNIISILHYAQDIYGYLPPELQRFIAKEVGVSSAHVNGIVTFYSFFNENKKGKYTVDVCMGTACFVKDSENIFNEFKKILQVDKEGLSKDGLFNLNSIRCIGACGIGPVVRVNSEIFGHMTVDQVHTIVERFRKESENEED